MSQKYDWIYWVEENLEGRVSRSVKDAPGAAGRNVIGYERVVVGRFRPDEDIDVAPVEACEEEPYPVNPIDVGVNKQTRFDAE